MLLALGRGLAPAAAAAGLLLLADALLTESGRPLATESRQPLIFDAAAAPVIPDLTLSSEAGEALAAEDGALLATQAPQPLALENGDALALETGQPLHSE